MGINQEQLRGELAMSYPGDGVARSAFDVMMRRGWFPVKEDVSPIAGESELAWTVYDERRLIVGGHSCPPLNWPDPFTALVEADRWYKEHVENG